MASVKVNEQRSFLSHHVSVLLLWVNAFCTHSFPIHLPGINVGLLPPPQQEAIIPPSMQAAFITEFGHDLVPWIQTLGIFTVDTQPLGVSLQWTISPNKHAVLCILFYLRDTFHFGTFKG